MSREPVLGFSERRRTNLTPLEELRGPHTRIGASVKNTTGRGFPS